MKKLLLFSLFGLTSVSAMAQKKNRIEIGMLQYQFLGAESQTSFYPSSFLELTIPSISYERTISPRFGAFVQYVGIPENSNIGYESRQEISEASVGKVQDRNSLNYADLGGSYSLIQGKRHRLSARLGLSYAWGTDVYVFRYVPPVNPLPECYFEPSTILRQESHFGALVGIRYDYSFWKNRLNTGLNFDARQYAGGFPFQVNYGAHVGFNF